MHEAQGWACADLTVASRASGRCLSAVRPELPRSLPELTRIRYRSSIQIFSVRKQACILYRILNKNSRSLSGQGGTCIYAGKVENSCAVVATFYRNKVKCSKKKTSYTKALLA